MDESVRTSFWQGKRVFLTSPNSFLGAWTALSLQYLGAQVFGYGESLDVSPNLFDLTNLGQSLAMTYGDLRNEDSLRQALQFAQADVVLHLGESGFLQEGEQRPLEILSKSVMGTAQLLDLLRETASVRAVLVVGSDKAYLRSPSNTPAAETSAVGPSGIFATAKLCSEFVALSYRESFFSPDKYNKHKVAVATARVTSAIGGGDFSSQALIFQAVQSFLGKKTFEVRNPQSVRPWIHVLDQVSGLLAVAQGLLEKGPKLSSSTYNIGASEYEAVGEVMKEFSQIWGATWASVSSSTAKTSLSLHGHLDSGLAKSELAWVPRWNLTTALEQTAGWYQGYYAGHASAEELTKVLREYYSA
ncbi:NAD-dependent epimerase/dehydratase family protein [Bdellovibrio sp. ArHS]|uniref:NAD-dependent epimerase/dehydratase family protein n=1 Tax=Bdellovibrio sp. ArHS TaxID=1569284 RepID=UPI000A51C8E5|nr:NAD-dependent epimerase/dehydratase family protein [Bdellovibrio sp. ArHS]